MIRQWEQEALRLRSRDGRETGGQNGTYGVSPFVTRRPGRVQCPAAPVSAARLAIIAEQASVLNFVARDGNPAALHEHANAVAGYPKGCRHAVSLRAATCSVLSHEIAVDVVGSERGGPKGDYD